MGCCYSEPISDSLRNEIFESMRDNTIPKYLPNSRSNQVLIIENKEYLDSPPSYNEAVKKE